MDIHKNARSCPASRELLVRRVLEQGWSVPEAAEAAGLSVRTAYKWLQRYGAEGLSGLADRSSRPRRSPGRTPRARRRRVVALRRQRMSGAEIAARLDMSPATVACILRRRGLHRLRSLEATEPPRRYEKLLHLGAKVVTASDSGGFIHDPDGFDEQKLRWLKELKEVRRGRIQEYSEAFSRATYHAGVKPWSVPVDLAFPCATQNELDAEDARQLLHNGLVAVAEGANMPSTPEAVRAFREARIPFAPGKAANAGGVAVSGLEQSQNALRISWSREEVDSRLQEIMQDIHARCELYGKKDDDYIDYVDGANIAGFVKVADAMLAYGVV